LPVTDRHGHNVIAAVAVGTLLDTDLRQAVRDEFELAGGVVDVATILSAAAGQAQSSA
jgi:hypothetical protein